MIKVKIVNHDPNEIMEIVRDLRARQMIQGTDFDFAYNKTSWDPVTGHHIEGPYTIFTFYKDKLATLFILKYGAIPLSTSDD